MQTTNQEPHESKTKAILEEASKLPVSKQEQVLAVIRGMLFTRSCFLKEKDRE